MVKYKALLVAPNGDWKVMYEKDSIEAVKRELEKKADKWQRYPYRFVIMPIETGNWINGGSKIVYVPDEYKFMEGWNIAKVFGWFIDKYLESHPIGDKNGKI